MYPLDNRTSRAQVFIAQQLDDASQCIINELFVHWAEAKCKKARHFLSVNVSDCGAVIFPVHIPATQGQIEHAVALHRLLHRSSEEGGNRPSRDFIQQLALTGQVSQSHYVKVWSVTTHGAWHNATRGPHLWLQTDAWPPDSLLVTLKQKNGHRTVMKCADNANMESLFDTQPESIQLLYSFHMEMHLHYVAQ